MLQIKDLGTEKTISDNSDLIPIQQADGTTRRITKANLFAGISSSGAYPTYFTHWHDESIVVSGGAIRTDTNASIAYAAETYQNPGANGDKFSFKKLIQAGNYKISVLTVRTTTVGILKLEIDGVTAFSDMDLYSSSLIVNAVLTKNITISTDGLHEFVWTINGKNTAANNYYFSGRKIWAIKI